jgi:hypothetical protein
MVTVPFDPLTRVQQRGSNAAFQSSDVPAGAFDLGGEGLIRAGQQLGAASDKLQSFALQMAQEDNETAAKEAENRIAERIRRVLYGGQAEDGTNVTGYMQTQRKATLDGFGPAEEAVRAAIQEELEKAGDNRNLASLIEKASSSRVNSALDRMTLYASEQRIADQQAVSLAREAQALADVSADPYNPEVLRRSMGVVAAEVLGRAEASGVTDQNEIDAMLREQQSIVLDGAFQAFITAEDVGAAQKLFVSNSDKLTPAVRQKMAQSLAENVRLTTAQQIARDVFNDPRFRGNRAAGIAEIDKLLDGSAQNAAMDLFRGYITDSRADTEWGRSLQAANEEEANRTRPERTQQIFDSVLAANPDASEGEVRRALQEAAGYGRDRTAVLQLYDEYVARERGDTSAARSTRKEEAFENSTSLVESWIREDKTRNEIRALIMDIEDPYEQEAAREFFNQQVSDGRSDIAEDRITEDEATLQEAQDIADAIFGNDELLAMSLEDGRYEAMRDAVAKETKGDAELRNAAWTLLDRRIGAQQGDAGYLRSLGAEARAAYNHQINLDKAKKEALVREARVAVYDHLYSEGTDNSLRAFRRINPEAYDVLAREGLADNLVSVERQIAEGQLFATSSDGETLARIKVAPLADQAEIDPVLYRPILTNSEFQELTNIVVRARRMSEQTIQDTNYGRQELERLTADFIKQGSDATPRDKKAMGRVVSAMDAWVSEQKTPPTPAQITTQAARLMLELRADVNASGMGGFFGVGNLSGDTLVAAMQRDLTPEQRANVRVDIEDINEEARRGVTMFFLERWQAPKRDVTEDELEQLTGAWAVGDTARFDRIIQTIGATRRTQ